MPALHIDALPIDGSSNAYGLLRRVSEGLGIDYVDRAGRRHKLYTWGDVPTIAERIQRTSLRERALSRDKVDSIRKAEEQFFIEVN